MLLWDLATCFELESIARQTRESHENCRRERTEAAAKHMEINQTVDRPWSNLIARPEVDKTQNGCCTVMEDG